MAYQTYYPWYIEPPTHGILTPLPMVFWLPIHGILTPLSISWLEMRGVNLPYRGGFQ